MKKIKMIILNYIVRHLFKGMTEKDLFKILNSRLFIDGEKSTEGQTQEYRNQAIKMKHSRVWKMIKAKMTYRSNELMFKNSKTTDDLFFGKAMLYNLDLIDQYLEKISKIK